jgi:uncharacterized membrane protein
MSTVEESIDLDVPVGIAYAQWTQFESFPQFMGGVESVTQLDDRRLHWVIDVAGVKREFDAEITEQHPEERVAWKSTDGTTHAGVVTFHKLDSTKSRVMLQLDWAPEGFVEKVGAAVGVDDRQITADLKRFKKLVETEPTADGWTGDIPREG